MGENDTRGNISSDALYLWEQNITTIRRDFDVIYGAQFSMVFSCGKESCIMDGWKMVNVVRVELKSAASA